MPKIAKKAEAKLDGVINPQNKLLFQSILTQNILVLSKRYK